MIVVGITGTIGAGKGTIVNFLVVKYGFKHFSVRNFISKEILKRGLKVDRDSLTAVANELRAKHSPSYIIDCLYEEALKTGENCIIESIRTPGEIEALRKKEFFTLVAVDADPKVRYNRIIARASETDHVSFETFLANEQREYSTDNPNKQNLKKCIELADYYVENNGTVEDLYKKLEKIFDYDK
ncbi:MAG: AAA family ATPase [Bacteroidales bacterium]|jgi:dephospho-CoA kinase|nr:AAA family ATPase [Bacteroidales bacterium]MDD2204502.1 AAA family ATPase [Bacteroidales bacterium]MDD3151432.1 AAA family ATPase [Bacteroidales bacterium]MDD3914616.1 AAA family ATPase [Bacteroidales bacterium]MDD4633815.1 AAA family ATPase [Bacteroidales bacterium]